MNERMTAEALEAIRARESRLLSEKWYFDGSDICESKNGNPVITANNYGDMMISEVVGQFIANSREDIPALLAEVDRLQAENAKYKDALLKIAHGDTWTAYPHDIAAWALGLKEGGEHHRVREINSQ